MDSTAPSDRKVVREFSSYLDCRGLEVLRLVGIRLDNTNASDFFGTVLSPHIFHKFLPDAGACQYVL